MVVEDRTGREPMVDIYIAETSQMLEKLEQCILSGENDGFDVYIDEIFRIMHSIKGSSSMMLFNDIAHLAHTLEDVFDYLRNEHPNNIEYSDVADIVLEGVDFFKNEVSKIESSLEPDGEVSGLIEKIKRYLIKIKKLNGAEVSETAAQRLVENEEHKYYIAATSNKINLPVGSRYKAVIFFQEDCGTESLRAFTITHGFRSLAVDIETYPEEIIGNGESSEIIRREGLQILFRSQSNEEDIRTYFYNDPFLRELELTLIDETEDKIKRKKEILLDEHELEQSLKKQIKEGKEANISSGKQNTISVNISKLDMLMDLVGELVIAEAMVTQNPELEGLELDGFHKVARHLKKISNELQDSVMSIRMVPLATTFQKMQRIVRDMSHKLNKDVQLEIIGEETEVDKGIIENISDPIMHIIRNSMDHGIESLEERINKGKSEKGTITLEAKNSGGDVWIIIKDDGKGLNKEKILKKAEENGILVKSQSEMTDKEIYSLIFLPGFSTKDAVSEFSGRGVGMDIVMKNIEKVRGTVSVDSIPDGGSTVYIKIPLTLAIINGMTIKVGNSRYTIPITSIKESFRVKNEDIVTDPDGDEMLLVRGEGYSIIRLHEFYHVQTDVTEISNGIITMLEDGGKGICLFSDALIGEQQVVVKPLPKYIKKVRGVAGCTLLGDGSISLILDATSLINL